MFVKQCYAACSGYVHIENLGVFDGELWSVIIDTTASLREADVPLMPRPSATQNMVKSLKVRLNTSSVVIGGTKTEYVVDPPNLLDRLQKQAIHTAKVRGLAYRNSPKYKGARTGHHAV